MDPNMHTIKEPSDALAEIEAPNVLMLGHQSRSSVAAQSGGVLA
jgi:hypothetical protein